MLEKVISTFSIVPSIPPFPITYTAWFSLKKGNKELLSMSLDFMVLYFLYLNPGAISFTSSSIILCCASYMLGAKKAANTPNIGTNATGIGKREIYAENPLIIG